MSTNAPKMEKPRRAQSRRSKAAPEPGPESRAGATIHAIQPDQVDPSEMFPNEEALLAAIERMAGIGLNSTDIAYLTGVDRTTLDTKYFEAQRRGRAKANMKVANTMFSIATDKAHPKCATMGIFYAKAHMGWSDAPPEDDGRGSDAAPRDPVGPDPVTDADVAGRFESLMGALRGA